MRVDILARVLTVRLVALADVAFKVRILAVTILPTTMLAVERLAVVAFKVRILAVTMLPVEILAVVAFSETILAYEETFMVVV